MRPFLGTQYRVDPRWTGEPVLTFKRADGCWAVQQAEGWIPLPLTLEATSEDVARHLLTHTDAALVQEDRIGAPVYQRVA